MTLADIDEELAELRLQRLQTTDVLGALALEVEIDRLRRARVALTMGGHSDE